jgi:hypothetical protein
MVTTKKKLKVSREVKYSEATHVLNPNTGRYILKGGLTHRKLLKQNELNPKPGKRLNREELTDEVQKRCLELYLENKELFSEGMSKEEIQTLFRKLLNSSMLGGKKKVRKRTRYKVMLPTEPPAETEYESSSDEEEVEETDEEGEVDEVKGEESEDERTESDY